jgi:hypothetical protein
LVLKELKLKKGDIIKRIIHIILKFITYSFKQKIAKISELPFLKN